VLLSTEMGDNPRKGTRLEPENLSRDCIVSLEFMQCPLNVLAAQHFEVCHKEVSCLNKAPLVKRGKFGEVKVVHFRHLRRKRERYKKAGTNTHKNTPNHSFNDQDPLQDHPPLNLHSTQL